MPTPTTRLNLDKPTIGGDTDQWGAFLNGALDILDQALVQNYGALQALDAPLGLADGAVGAPGLTWSSDTDTGWFRPAANTAALATGGTEALRVSDGQNLLAGTITDNGHRLDVQKSSSGASVTVLNIANPNTSVTGTAARLGLSGQGNADFRGVYIEGEVQAASNSHDMIFGVSAASSAPAEVARITSGGYFKASNDGTYSSATGSLHELNQSDTGRVCDFIASNASPQGIRIDYTGAAPNGLGNSFMVCLDTSATRFQVRSNGGIANFQSNDVDLSDERLKDDAGSFGSQWDCLKQLTFHRYRYKDQNGEGKVHLGLYAQELESVCPEMVDNSGGMGEIDGDPIKTIYTKDFGMMVASVVQELQARVEALEQA